MDYLYIKSLHIIFIVTWFAGLFYIVRLFIYHTEANDYEATRKNILQEQYKIMERRLWYGITWPSMILTLVFGSWLVYESSFFLYQSFFIVKLCFVFGLILYHLKCHGIFRQLQKNEIKYSSFKLRIWNEVATVFLVAIVFLIVVRTNSGFVKGMLGLIVFTALLMLVIKIYKNKRGEDSDK